MGGGVTPTYKTPPGGEGEGLHQPKKVIKPPREGRGGDCTGGLEPPPRCFKACSEVPGDTTFTSTALERLFKSTGRVLTARQEEPSTFGLTLLVTCFLSADCVFAESGRDRYNMHQQFLYAVRVRLVRAAAVVVQVRHVETHHKAQLDRCISSPGHTQRKLSQG